MIGVVLLLATHLGTIAALAPHRGRSLIVVPIVGLSLATLDVMAVLVSLDLVDGVESLTLAVLAALLACAMPPAIVLWAARTLNLVTVRRRRSWALTIAILSVATVIACALVLWPLHHALNDLGNAGARGIASFISH